MGLHLGWIPNEPGLRPRDFGQPAPSEPAPDPAKVAAAARRRSTPGGCGRGCSSSSGCSRSCSSASSRRSPASAGPGGWRRGWRCAAGCRWCCSAVNRRRAAHRLRAETEQRAARHAAELAEYEQGKAAWARVGGGADRRRPALAAGGRARGHQPARRLRRDRAGPAEHGDRARLGAARRARRHRARPVAGPGGRRPARRGAAQAGISCQDYQLPARPGRDAAAGRADRRAGRVADRRGGARRRRERDRRRARHRPDDPQEDHRRARRRRVHGAAARGADLLLADGDGPDGPTAGACSPAPRSERAGLRGAVRRRLPAAGRGQPGPARGRGRAADRARHRRRAARRRPG